MERVFHPIGQGAFYSERHGNFNIVYDCGENKTSKRAKESVISSFKPGTEIDFLFISHFDNDHVSLIKTLKESFRIKNVVMPLLYKEETEILAAYYKSQDNKEIVQLISNTEEYFGSETRVISVEEGNEENIIVEEINIKETSINPRIKSGTPILVGEWIYCPYNHKHRLRNIELRKCFDNVHLDYKKFIEDLDYCLENRAKARKAFNMLDGKINENSMFLYSGPKHGDYYVDSSFTSVQTYFLPCYRCMNTVTRKAACIYTGDGDLNIVEIKRIFNNYWMNVGTIQVPHHGDIKSFNNKCIENGKYFLPISYGTNNSYGHPSLETILDIIKSDSQVILVTEKKESTYIQILKKDA